ncbi:hypothetical protein [Sphingomonas immobilis]|uniref:Hedgehog/Intein (Hint) domain-containing protein n=1 Tax=Sphingomonas immobilis TaxID=3063997 RepID=A0ABT8ZYH6_9SPHN|nr:hypothetical protein [Sphingomonas sp. CA1-15]MDO7842621.1 hypothetical protein [Sphingomonas sp. CA1-15]
MNATASLAVKEAPSADVPTVFEGIVRKRCLSATYNRTEVTLAPHVIYTRHGDLFVDGVVIERDGKPPKELKLGTFKLAGLTALRLTPRAFKPSPLFIAGDPKYAETALMTVEP